MIYNIKYVTQLLYQLLHIYKIYKIYKIIPNWYSEINVTFYSVTLARTIWLPDDGPRTKTCQSVLMCKFYKFYICAVVGIIIE